MLTSEALNFFGSKSKVAKAAGIELQSFYKWKELVPEARASRLEEASGGVLRYDKEVYDRHRQSRRKTGKNTDTTRKESD